MQFERSSLGRRSEDRTSAFCPSSSHSCSSRIAASDFPSSQSNATISPKAAMRRRLTPCEVRDVRSTTPPIVDTRGDGALQEFFFNFVYEPLREPTGQVDGIFVHAVDRHGPGS